MLRVKARDMLTHCDSTITVTLGPLGPQGNLNLNELELQFPNVQKVRTVRDFPTVSVQVSHCITENYIHNTGPGLVKP